MTSPFFPSSRADQCSTALSQYEYYQHDQDESLEGMTMTPVTAAVTSTFVSQIPTPISSRSVSSPSCSIASTAHPPYSDSSFSDPRTITRDSRSPMFAGEFNSRIPIPRKIKSSVSSETCDSLKKATPAASNKRSSFTISSNIASPEMSTAASNAVTNSTLINTSGCGGGGDSVNLHPEVEQWLDMIPLSKKPFKNFHRDFADGVLVAEIMSACLPKKVDLHNYVPASASSNKKNNWDTLNQKVFSKIGIKLGDPMIDGILQAKPGFIEKALRQIHRVVENLDKRQTVTRKKELSALAASFNGLALEPPFVEELCLVRNIPGEIPDCVIYQNIKYFSSTAFEDVAKSEEQLRERNNELSNKVRRLETLVSLKESHLQDLTSKIHELRGKYESARIYDSRNDDSLS